MIRCTRCVMPNTRPDTAFVDGICSACLSYERRPQIDWEARKRELIALLDRHGGRCIVASSGGKDSHYIALTLKEMGADVTAVTATTCHLTPIGRRNIDNLARHVRTIEVTPNRTVRAKLNRLGLELVGDISWPEHVSIFTTPFRMSAVLAIPLIFYGENPQDQYGGPIGSDEARRLTARWRSEFGGFLGLRPSDMVGQLGITKRDMGDYQMPTARAEVIEAHFLGQYLPWDSYQNANISMAAGMEAELPCEANHWPWENLDNAQTGLHDWLMFLKYGYGRGCAQMSVDLRIGRHKSRVGGLSLVKQHDGLFPWKYADVTISEVLGRIDLGLDEFMRIARRFANPAAVEYHASEDRYRAVECSQPA